MLKCDRIDISEGIDVNKTSLSKECDNVLKWVLIMLLLFILREVLTEFIYGIWVKTMQLT